MPTATPTASSPKGTPPDLIGKAGTDIESMPQQVEELSRELVHWFLRDSFSALTGLALGVLLYSVMVLLRGWARRRLSRMAEFGTWSWVALKVLARTRSFFLMMLSAKIVIAVFGGPGTWSSLIHVLFTIGATVQGAFWIREFLLALVERKASDAHADPSMSSAVGVLSVIINIVVWGIAGIILLDNLGVNVTALIAGLGVGGIAIGLAAQGIFSDLFAALSILMDRPFVRGDTIQVGGPQGAVGKVEHIGLKTTRLRAVSGEIVVMSNAQLLNQQINNLAQFDERRVVMTLQLIYQTPPDLLEEVPAILEQIVNAVPHCRFERANFVQFNASSLDFEMIFHVSKPDFDTMSNARHRVGLTIVREFARRGIAFAYPTQMSFLGGVDGLIAPPHPPMSSAGNQNNRPAGKAPDAKGATKG